MNTNCQSNLPIITDYTTSNEAKSVKCHQLIVTGKPGSENPTLDFEDNLKTWTCKTHLIRTRFQQTTKVRIYISIVSRKR